MESPENQRPGRLKALVVAEDPRFLAFAGEALHSFRPGFEVATARTCEEGLEWLDTFLPDLILVGSGQPGQGDEALSGRIREDPRTAGCKVMTVHDGDEAWSLPVLLGNVRAMIDH